MDRAHMSVTRVTVNCQHLSARCRWNFNYITPISDSKLHLEPPDKETWACLGVALVSAYEEKSVFNQLYRLYIIKISSKRLAL